jgi:aminoglycoside phosphotransferase (APT) family kinase protein
MTEEEYVDRLLDETALTDYLTTELDPVDQYEVHRHRAGHSNETLFLTWGTRELVLRRPPPGSKADTAHNVLREHRVMDALQETDVRVPTTVLACDDPDVIGDDFYVMERTDGDVIRTDEPERFAEPERRRRIGEELVDRLAEVHAVDYETVGLADFGRPEGYIDRQVQRWHKQFEWASTVTASVREVDVLDEVGAWLDENVPTTTRHTLVHGDYKLDNVMVGQDQPPEIVGIFDWELSTLGDPLLDLGWLVTYWRDADDPSPAIPELVPTFTERDGYPEKSQLIERYENATGTSFEHGRFYRALSVYKLAALCEMFYRRYLEENADNPMYPKMEERVPAIADWAQRIIDGEEPL